MLLYITEVQEINIAESSQEAGRKRVRRTKSDQCRRLQFMYSESENGEELLWPAGRVFAKQSRPGLISKKLVPNKKKQAECESCGNDRYASIGFIYRVGVEHYC